MLSLEGLEVTKTELGNQLVRFDDQVFFILVMVALCVSFLFMLGKLTKDRVNLRPVACLRLSEPGGW